MRSPLPTLPGRDRYYLLDGLRGFAAIAVGLLHYRWTLMPGGYLAVDLFFMLSGFVLARSYQDALTSGLAAAAFLRKRLVRLYPLYLAGTLGGALLAARQFRHSIDPAALQDFAMGFGFNLAMLPNPSAPVLFPFNPASWSLFYELLANAVLALVLVRLSRRRLVLACLVFGAALVTAALIMSHSAAGRAVYSSHVGVVAMGVEWQDWPLALLRTLFSFTVGVTLATLHTRDARKLTNWAALPIAVMIGCFLVQIAFSARIGFDLVFVMLVAPLLLVAGIRLQPGPRLAAICAVLGELSYAFYALHLPILQLFKQLAERTGLSEMSFAPLYLATVLGLSWLATRYYDVPLRRWLTGRLEGKKEFART